MHCSYLLQKVEGTENETVSNPKSGRHVPLFPMICARGTTAAGSRQTRDRGS